MFDSKTISNLLEILNRYSSKHPKHVMKIAGYFATPFRLSELREVRGKVGYSMSANRWFVAHLSLTADYDLFQTSRRSALLLIELLM